MKDLIKKLELYFGKKAPQLPKEVKEWIVKLAPYLAILGVLVALPSVLTLLGLNGMMRGFYSYSYRSNMGLYMIINLVSLVLYAIAIPGLFKKNAQGWNFTFYSILVSLLGSLLMFNLGGFVVGLIVGFYFLFQVKAYYFGGAVVTEAPAEPTTSESAAEETVEEKSTSDEESTPAEEENVDNQE